MGLLRTFGGNTPGEPFVAPWLWGSIVVGLGLALVVLILAWRASQRAMRIRRALMAGAWSAVLERAAPSRLLALGATIGPLLVATATILALQRSRGLIVDGLRISDPDRQGEVLYHGLLGELSSTIVGSLGVVLPLLLGAVAAALAESARRRRGGLLRAAELAGQDRPAAQAWAAFPGPSASVLGAVFLAFVLLSFGPIIWSAVAGTWHVLRAIDAGASLDPFDKMALLKAAELSATKTFEHGHLASSVGAVCAGLGSGILLWLTSPARARAKLLGRPAVARPSRPGVAAALLLASACALLALARPMKRENETPWPPGQAIDLVKAQTPAVDGPDDLAPGTLVEMTASGQSVNGSPQDLVGLENELRVDRNNFSLLHPGASYRPRIIFVCSPEVSADRVFQVMQRALRSGWDAVSFAFQTNHTLFRPVLGAITWRNVTAAHAWLTVAAAPVGVAVVGPDDASDCGALSGRIVALRRAHRDVVLLSRPSRP
jgi:hypothetical protein